MKGSQLGATEPALNWIGYIIHHAPGLALLVMPSLDMAAEHAHEARPHDRVGPRSLLNAALAKKSKFSRSASVRIDAASAGSTLMMANQAAKRQSSFE
jgi:phage terminase large subunit GpA-like protein